MITEIQHPLVTRYLKDLERALRDIPADKRRDIVDDIKTHIAEAAADRGEEMTESELRSLLDQVGHPEAIAEDARERFGIQRRRGGAMEGLAIGALLVGGLIVPGVGWLLGIILLWASSVWSMRDKILGTLVIPGGLAGAAFLSLMAMPASNCVAANGSECPDSGSIPFLPEAFLVALAVAPIAVAIYLGRKAFRRP